MIYCIAILVTVLAIFLWVVFTAPFTYESEETNSAPFPRGHKRKRK